MPKPIRARLSLAVLLLCGFIAGCDREDGRDPLFAKNGTQGAPATGAAGQIAAGPATGVIRGKIKFTGTKPPAKPVQRDCHPGVKVMIPDETYLVGPGGELKNAVVFLKNPPEVPGAQTPPAPVIDQVNCIYVPHVVAARVGQQVTFTSGDPVLHNVHVIARENGETNQSQQKGETRTMEVKAAEFMTVKCDVHPWMTAKIAAFDHPFYAVTGDDGSFVINGLPSGSYTIGVWHEKLGQRAQDVSVALDKAAEVVITVEKK
jgi:plastocyanin